MKPQSSTTNDAAIIKRMQTPYTAPRPNPQDDPNAQTTIVDAEKEVSKLQALIARLKGLAK